jgi:hypothetical protein
MSIVCQKKDLKKFIQCMHPIGLVLASIMLTSCSRSALEPTPPPPPPDIDNLIDIEGRFCGEPPEEKAFPIKILFVIDQSTSLQCTDSQNRRVRVLNELVNRLAPQPNIYLGFIGFANWSREQGFTQNPQEMAPYLDPSQGLGPATDYQGALATALRLLESDMVESGVAVRARSRYIVTFISDGAPEPRCRLGCEDDQSRCGDGIDNDGDGLLDMSDDDCEDIDDISKRPDSLYGVCNTTAENREPFSETYVGMEGLCPAYNQPEQLQKQIDDLRGLETIYGVGELTLNTVLLSSPQAVIESVCGPASSTFGYNTEQARSLLSGMADAGGGSFRDVNLADTDGTFLDFDYSSLRSTYYVREFYVRNPSFISDPLQELGGVVDSDGDGLSDAEEYKEGTNHLSPDSDEDRSGRVVGDGYGDLFEVRFKYSGFDPLNPDAPALTCNSRGDRDGDGLSDCEELFLNTDPLNSDCDGDLLLDGFELFADTNPLKPDAELDGDLDGVINRDEMRAGSNPRVAEPRVSINKIRYDVQEIGELIVTNEETYLSDERRCYDFKVRDIPLLTTLAEDKTRRGLNHIYLTSFSQPLSSAEAPSKVRRACVEAVMSGPLRKEPGDKIDITPEGWQWIRDQLYLGVDDISDCVWANVAQPNNSTSVPRDKVIDLINTCLPDTLDVNGYRFDKESVIGRVYELFDRRMYLTIPQDPINLFVPLAQFDPEIHCYRPKHTEEMVEMLNQIAMATCSCESEQNSGGEEIEETSDEDTSDELDEAGQ